MNAATTKHPDDALLTQFLQGRLAADAHAEVENHVLSCDDCCRRMEPIPRDTLAEQVRSTDTTAGPRGQVCPTHTATNTQEIPAELRDHPRYRVIRPLGAGAMGAVFQAEHRRMERLVALK